jgi:tetratricopeptide (TPR) repeat protein
MIRLETKKAFLNFALICFVALSGCQPKQTHLETRRVGVKAPEGNAVIKKAVDGLVVGHRLMASGEYELAIKAYNRSVAKTGLTADVLSALGSANLQLDRLGQAEKLLRAAVKKDDKFAAAWNNLGVVLSSTGELREAVLVFRIAFGLDSGKSDEIRMNLTRALAKLDKPVYVELNEHEEFELVRRGNGRFLLLQTPTSNP